MESTSARWVAGTLLAVAMVLAGVSSALAGVAIALARDSAGADLTGQATARVEGARDDPGEIRTDLTVTYRPPGGGEVRTVVAWHASDAPRPGGTLTVAYDPAHPADARPFGEIDPTGGWAAEWHPLPWLAGGGLGLAAALAVLVATSRWARRRR